MSEYRNQSKGSSPKLLYRQQSVYEDLRLNPSRNLNMNYTAPNIEMQPRPIVANNFRSSGDPKTDLVNSAASAWSTFHPKGKAIKEKDPSVYGIINSYWKTGGRHKKDWKTDQHWSAAFISTMVMQAGYKDFKFSAAHSDYVRQAVKNRKNNTGSYKGYKPEEMAVKVGDIIVAPDPIKSKHVTYDTDEYYASHGDIVVSIDDGKVTTIGGNVSDTVGKQTFALDEDGKLKGTNHHVVIRFN